MHSSLKRLALALALLVGTAGVSTGCYADYGYPAVGVGVYGGGPVYYSHHYHGYYGGGPHYHGYHGGHHHH